MKSDQLFLGHRVEFLAWHELAPHIFQRVSEQVKAEVKTCRSLGEFDSDASLRNVETKLKLDKAFCLYGYSITLCELKLLKY
ncbi:MAG: hypothetical protein L0196_08430 [candidate division Zixibacteria bacterium]|nr:hypothetical protein [candidate division Zixibacteria bacterium]